LSQAEESAVPEGVQFTMGTVWHVAHLFAIGAWAGLVASEMAMELVARRNPKHHLSMAHFHHVIDRFVEVPLLCLIVITGTVLLFKVHIDTLLWIKVACASAAIGINLWCWRVVVARNRLLDSGDDGPEADRLTSRVFRAVYTALPLALIAFYLGARRAGWL
jgi:hypothetical protein